MQYYCLYQKKGFALKVNLLKCIKEYDIRGVFGKELNEEYFYYLGRIINASSIVVGKDARCSSPLLMKAFLQGLLDSGAQIYEMNGVSTSPLIYFAQKRLNTDDAAIITASHNAMEFNGIKLVKGGRALYGASLKKILENKARAGKGIHKIIDLRSEYKEALSQKLDLSKQIKVAWDCFNSGVAEILKQMNVPITDIISMEKKRFLNTPPDPLITANLENLKNKIKEGNSDIGFAFDGDGDRLVVIKKDGIVLTSDQVIYLITKLINQKGKIILDVKASTKLINKLRLEGYEVILASGGHSIMKEKIIEENAIFAGEASGHYIINDGHYYAFDDALYVAFRIIDYLQTNFLFLLEIFPVRNEYRVAKKDCYPKEVYSLMGLRKEFDRGWYLIRSSNTEDNVLVKYEAEDSQEEELIKKEISELLSLQV